MDISSETIFWIKKKYVNAAIKFENVRTKYHQQVNHYDRFIENSQYFVIQTNFYAWPGAVFVAQNKTHQIAYFQKLLLIEVFFSLHQSTEVGSKLIANFLTSILIWFSLWAMKRAFLFFLFLSAEGSTRTMRWIPLKKSSIFRCRKVLKKPIYIKPGRVVNFLARLFTMASIKTTVHN